MKKIPILLTTSLFALTSVSAHSESINDLEVNKYDCSVEEVKNYMNKRTSSLKQETGLATWSDFKENAVLISDSSRGGSVPDGAYQGQSDGGMNEVRQSANSSGDGADEGGSDDEEDQGGMFSDCPTFGDSSPDWSSPDWMSIWEDAKEAYNSIAMPSGGSGVMDTLREGVNQAKEELNNFMDKGFCNMVRDNVDWESIEEQGQEYASSLQSEAVEEASARTDAEMEDQTGQDLADWTGKDLEEIEESDSEELRSANMEHNIINNALEESDNDSGKLVNVFDSRLDDNREEAKEDEKERQQEKLTDKILGRD